MGSLPENPTSTTNSHLYPQALQLKLYQAFIFSIPILFSIILFLLFYLFYLKRRASSLSSSQPFLPTTNHTQAAPATTYHVSSACPVGLKGELKEKLETILFDEELKKKDSQCCVCLGEFEMEEDLLQVMSCKHVFHVECIHHWLYNNTTCPLCRCSVIPICTKVDIPATSVSDQQTHSIIISNHSPGIVLLDQHIPQQQHQLGNNASLNVTASIGGTSSGSGTILGDSDRLSGLYINQDLREPVTIRVIQTHDSS